MIVFGPTSAESLQAERLSWTRDAYPWRSRGAVGSLGRSTVVRGQTKLQANYHPKKLLCAVA